jgi:ABC-type branched-subunit amino acid transport system substrate-binding protein
MAIRPLIPCLLAATLAVVSVGCRGTRPATMPHFLGDARAKAIDPSQLDPELAAKWETLRKALADDPGAMEIGALADDVLGNAPPVPVQVDALRAKAVNAYAMGLDVEAIAFADDGLARAADGGGPQDAIMDLARTRIRAYVRGGDPAVALAAVRDPEVRAAFEEPVLAGLEAVALERNAEYADALAAFARWREATADDSPEALYAEERIHGLAPTLDKPAIVAVAAGLSRSRAQLCLMTLTGTRPPGEDDPAWVQRCARRPERIGVLLPRTGPLSALADTQLGAASVAVATLTPGGGKGVLWRDAGGTPESAVEGARDLIAAGADAIVGPIGVGPIDAVTQAVGNRVEVIVPGEGRGAAKGVAPTLESRVAALVAHARGAGVRRFLVVAPEGAYGRRAVKAIEVNLEDREAKGLIVQMYPLSTTSFAPVLAPLQPAFRDGTALLVPDHMNRVELVVRQLHRSGHPPAAPDAGLLVLTTGEGADAAALERGRKVFDELRMAPTAVPTDAAAAFVEAYRLAEGERPGDQALLVFYAFRRALLGDTAGAVARVLRVESGQLSSR